MAPSSVPTVPAPKLTAAHQDIAVRGGVVQTDLIPNTKWADLVPKLEATPGVRMVGRGEGVVVFHVTEAAGTAPGLSPARDCYAPLQVGGRL